MSFSILAETAKKPLPIGEIVLDSDSIRERVFELASRISKDYAAGELTVVGILKGAFLFTCDLARALEISTVVDFIGISRYRGSPDVKEVRITHDLGSPLVGKDVLLVEDIVDTGLTLFYLIDVLKQRKPRSITVCSLLDRPALRLVEIPMRYVGFDVAEEFLVGYGLDYRDQYRNLPFIAKLDL